MVIHQLELAKKAKNETNDEKVVEHLRGKISLREALGVDEPVLASFRRQAAVLARAEKWQSCADVIEGLVALDAAGTEEAVLLARAYEALGEKDKAAAVGAILANVFESAEARAAAMEVNR